MANENEGSKNDRELSDINQLAELQKMVTTVAEGIESKLADSLSKLTGHSSLGITLQYYQPTEADLRRAIEGQ